MTYERRKEQGLCVGCGKVPPRNGKIMCAECAEKQRVYREDTRKFFKSIGICPRCGKNKLFGDEKTCPECLAYAYAVNNKSKANRNFNSKEWYKKDIAMLKSQGLCRSCRKEKIAIGHTYCPSCLIKHRERAAKYKNKKDKSGLDRSERPNYGLCYFCGNPIDRDGRTCKKCAEIVKKNLPKTGGNSLWKEQNKLIFRNRGEIRENNTANV